MAVFDETLFTLAPVMYRALDGACRGQRGGGPAGPAPVAPAFLRFGSWVGADRDGNPLVTAQVTREAAVIQADHALRALENATSRIGRALTVHAEAAPPGAGLALALEAAETDHPELLAGLAERSPQEPYRTYLLYLAERLRATRLRQADLAYPGCAGLPGRPAARAGRPGRGRCRPPGVRRAAEPDLAGADVRLPRVRAGDPPAQRRALPRAARDRGRRGGVRADRRDPRHPAGGGLDPGPVRRGRLPPVRGQLHPVGRRRRRRVPAGPSRHPPR